MPTLPTNIKCGTLGCKNNRAKHSSHCIQHGGTDTFNKLYRHKDKYQNRTDKYQSKEWKSFRAKQLSEYPLCAGCLSGGIVTAANTVDHIFPWALIGEEAFSKNIFQSLCVSCHSSKSGLESKGKYRRYGKPNIDYTLNDYAYIIYMHNG